MKSFIYYSPSMKEIVVVVAEDTKTAAVLCVKEAKGSANDYYLATTCDIESGSTTSFDIEHFDDMKNESDLNAFESQSLEQ